MDFVENSIEILKVNDEINKKGKAFKTVLDDLSILLKNKHKKYLTEKNIKSLKKELSKSNETKMEKILKQIDDASDSFIYMVSSTSTTGSQAGFGQPELDYFKRIHDLFWFFDEVISLVARFITTVKIKE